MDKLKNKIQDQRDQMNVDEPNAATWNAIKNSLSGLKDGDLLKEHIAENKNRLDIEIPAPELWSGIKKSRIEKPVYVLHIKKRMVYLSAACILVILSLGIVRYIYSFKTSTKDEIVQTDTTNSNRENTTQPGKESELTITKVLTDPGIKPTIKEKSTIVAASTRSKKQKKKLLPAGVREIEQDYNELIAAQIKYTRSLAIYGESAGYFEQFKNDFKLLEKQETELRKSIARNGLQENSITDLSMIYQEKLTVLKKLQNEIKKTSTRNKNLTDTIPAYINL
jgi:hypothetical protein